MNLTDSDRRICLGEEIAAVLQAHGVAPEIGGVASHAVVEVVTRHATLEEEEERSRVLMAGGAHGLATELVAALTRAHERLLPFAGGDHELAYEAGHGVVAMMLSQAVAEPAIAGWCFGRARQASLLRSVQSAVRELAIAAGVLDVDLVGTRRAGMVVDAVHAAVDELDSLYTDPGDGR